MKNHKGFKTKLSALLKPAICSSSSDWRNLLNSSLFILLSNAIVHIYDFHVGKMSQSYKILNFDDFNFDLNDSAQQH